MNSDPLVAELSRLRTRVDALDRCWVVVFRRSPQRS